MVSAQATSRISKTAAFWGIALTLSLMLFASSAPSPLYVVYQAEWDFSAITLTSVFAIYALALLVTLLVAGSVSDHVGRKPTLIVALVLEIVAMVAFAEAGNVEWLFAARALQGVATGLAMGAITAGLLDLQPDEDGRLGAVVGVAAPLSGLATGALATGLLVQYGPDPTHFVYWLLVAAFALAIPFAAAIPETVQGDGRWVRSLRPKIAVPAQLRVAFISTIPCMVACWALGGLILSLGPSLTVAVLGNDSHLAGGLPIFVMAGISAVASVRLREAHARATARGGLAALIAGVAIVLVALGLESTGVFLIGTAVAGLGFGPAFAGAFRALSTQAPQSERGSFVSAILTVAYLAFSLPAVAAGIAVTEIGLRETAYIYGVTLIALASLALVLSRQLQDPQSALAPA